MRKVNMMVLCLLLLMQAYSQEINIAFISDLHYGITRPHFRGKDLVDAQVVNEAMIEAIKVLPVKRLDYIAITGDFANRQEIPIQRDSISWGQFQQDYLRQFTTPFLLTPGNHDVSNAIGHYKPMLPKTDATSMVAVYNLMLHPAIKKTNQTYHYATDKINYSRNIGGIHFMFINIWPDSANLIWMEKDIKTVNPQTPVLIFAHDPPDGDAKHFSIINNSLSQCHFENLLTEDYKDGDCESTNIEQRRWSAFLTHHANVKAYFHGHSNYNEFYTYKGIEKNLSLPVFRVDSPMKGKYSAKDESLLSFQVITIDTMKKQLTDRQYFWNKIPAAWGESKTVSLN